MKLKLGMVAAAMIATSALCGEHGISPNAHVVLAKVPTPNYGTTSGIALPVPASDFQPWYPAAAFIREDTYAGFYFLNNANPTLAIAPAPVPTGAIIERLELIGCDPSASKQIRFYIMGFSGSLGAGITSPTLGTTGVASVGGCGTYSVTLSPAITVASGDLFNVVAWLDESPDSTLLVHGMRVLYRLEVSPAPLTATFSDVATTHSFHRFVEALAAAGITVGCGGTKFCPDDNVTRGQMAVFLSVALGLHHPD